MAPAGSQNIHTILLQFLKIEVQSMHHMPILERTFKADLVQFVTTH